MPAAPVADQAPMKGIIVAIVATAFCTAGICFVAFKSSRARSAEVKERGANLDGLVALASGGLENASVNANEAAAIATLKNILVAQAMCRASTSIDANRNGQGEYGFFAELSGKVPVRGGIQTISPPVLSTAFGNISTASTVARSGYVFQMFLPDAAQTGCIEAGTVGGGPGTPKVDPSQCETLWCCYAWPQVQGTSGNRAFFINERKDVLACSNTNAQYNGREKGPAFTAAFRRGTTTMADMVAANTVGNDSEKWLVVY